MFTSLHVNVIRFLQEGNQEVFAMDLFEGEIRLHYTNAEGGLDSVVVNPDANEAFSGKQLKH